MLWFAMVWYAKTWYAMVCESMVLLVARLLLVDSDRWESGPGKGQPCIFPRALLSRASLDRARLQTISHNGCNISQTGTRRGIVMAQRKGLHVAGVGSQGRSCACKGQPPCIKSRGTAHLLLRVSDPEQTLIRITLIPLQFLVSFDFIHSILNLPNCESELNERLLRGHGHLPNSRVFEVWSQLA